MSERTGSCLCGEVKYRISSEPLAARVCWCTVCQKIAANGTVNVMFPSDSIEFTGMLAEFISTADSGDRMVRRFCPTCGTHVFSNSSSTPQITGVRAGTLTDPSSIRPSMNIWVKSAPTWACMDTSLESVDAQPKPPQRPKS